MSGKQHGMETGITQRFIGIGVSENWESLLKGL